MNRSIICAALTLGAAVSLVRPSSADVHVGVNVGIPAPPSIVIESPPRLVIVPDSPVTYAPDLPYSYFFFDGRYWVYDNGRWFSASAYNGPWTYVTVQHVPPPIVQVRYKVKKVPPGHGHPKHHGGGKHRG